MKTHCHAHHPDDRIANNEDDGIEYTPSASITTSALTTTTFLGRSDGHGDDTPLIWCWDDCFDAMTLDAIDATGQARSHGFTTIWDRTKSPPRSRLEWAIGTLLERMEREERSNYSSNHKNNNHERDVTPYQSVPPHHHRYVEYWWRDKARLLEAHRDIDEVYCRKHQIPLALGSSQKMGLQRCPSFGHVLYVHVDENEDENDTDGDCLAPTLVWQEQKESEDGKWGMGAPRKLEKLYTIPAVSNRLLRFRGDCLHAVGHRPLSFLHPRQQDDEWTTAATKTIQQCRRAVLLFNTWEQPPLYPPVGEPLSASEMNDFSTESFPIHQRHHNWKPQEILRDDRDNKSIGDPDRKLARFSFPLLGDVSRRGCTQDSLDALVDKALAISALTSKRDIHCLSLYPITDKA